MQAHISAPSRGDGLPVRACRLHPGAQPADRGQGSAAATGVGGHRLPTRNIAMWGPASAHPCHCPQPPGPRGRALVSIDSKSLYHEAKAAGIIYQATLRRELHPSLGLEWNPVDEYTGMAEIAGVDKECLKAWSQRSTRLREWANHNLTVVDGKPERGADRGRPESHAPRQTRIVGVGGAQGAVARRWRGLHFDRGAHYAARAGAGALRGAPWTARASRRWPRASTRPRSPARTWWS